MRIETDSDSDIYIQGVDGLGTISTAARASVYVAVHIGDEAAGVKVELHYTTSAVDSVWSARISRFCDGAEMLPVQIEPDGAGYNIALTVDAPSGCPVVAMKERLLGLTPVLQAAGDTQRGTAR